MKRRLALIAALYALAISLTVLVVRNVTTATDSTVLLALNKLAAPWLDTLMQAVTMLGEPVLLGGFCVVVFLYLLSRRRPYEAIIFAIAMVGTSLINIGLKYSIMRSRPELWDVLAAETSFSFPSGHSMGSASLALILAYLYRRHHYRGLIVGGLLIFTVLVGISRMYLGVHFPTDILAGWTYSAAWVVTVITVGKRLSQRL